MDLMNQDDTSNGNLPGHGNASYDKHRDDPSQSGTDGGAEEDGMIDANPGQTGEGTVERSPFHQGVEWTSGSPATDIRVLGIGGAGVRALERLHADRPSGVSLAAISTDIQTLAASTVPVRLQIGFQTTRGMSAGGDPDQGRAAAEQDEASIRKLVSGARIVFLLVGLGGGTGSGAAPLVAQVAREAGALVIGVAALPFGFEGRRRSVCASDALRHLKFSADAVICVPNERVLTLFHSRAHFTDMIDEANRLLVHGVLGLVHLLTRPGLIQVDVAHIERLLKGRHAESVFATVQADGDQRSQDVLEKLLASPFLDRGDALTSADAVLISVSGGQDLMTSEVQWLMDEIQRRCEEAQVVVGTSIDPALQGRIVLTVVASRGSAGPDSWMRGVGGDQVGENSHRDNGAPEGAERADGTAGEAPESLSSTLAEEYGASESVDTRRRASEGTMRGNPRHMRPVQTLLNLELPSKGRFDKTQSNMWHGEDLDVPTFIRRGWLLN
jgi:cell division protein FtsZ